MQSHSGFHQQPDATDGQSAVPAVPPAPGQMPAAGAMPPGQMPSPATAQSFQQVPQQQYAQPMPQQPQLPSQPSLASPFPGQPGQGAFVAPQQAAPAMPQGGFQPVPATGFAAPAQQPVHQPPVQNGLAAVPVDAQQPGAAPVQPGGLGMPDLPLGPGGGMPAAAPKQPAAPPMPMAAPPMPMAAPTAVATGLPAAPGVPAGRPAALAFPTADVTPSAPSAVTPSAPSAVTQPASVPAAGAPAAFAPLKGPIELKPVFTPSRRSGGPMKGGGAGRSGPPPVASGMNFKGATAMQLAGKRLRIGEVLMDMGMIDEGQLTHALSIQKETGQRLGKVLIQQGLVNATDIAKALARRLSIEYVDLGEISIPNEVLSIVSPDLCARYDFVPIDMQGTSILIAMADPTNVFAIDDIKLVTGRDIRVVVASPDSIELVQSRSFNIDDAVAEMADAADDWGEDHVQLEDIKDASTDAPAIQLVNQVINKAVVEGVSDLHFEPQAEDMLIRFRRDGVLVAIATVPHKLRAGVTSRIKIMANLDISERRKPQDGRVGLIVGGRPIDLRVATLPTVYGEMAVMRVLDKSNATRTMDELGFLPKQIEKLRYCYTQPYGCILVTGPTGSGKSTTLYAALNEVNDVSRKIITTEDPVEYRLKGINQVQTNAKAGLTFAAALRSILRCDPDVVMIGEMRDHETASIGIEAALTGHLVLSTLHTNTAPGALTRLTEMKIEPYLVSSSVLGVLAQRLVRRLCKCKEAWTPDRAYLEEHGFPEEVINGEPPTLYRSIGCHRCDDKGFKGRMGVHEVMLMSEEIAALAVARASAEEIEKVAVEQGMITLWMDGVAKILRGDTTMEELQRVVQH